MDTQDISLFRISRTGFPPLRFNGYVLAKGDTRVLRGERQNRWVEVTIYRTQGGKYVYQVERVSQWQGESCSTEAGFKAQASEIVEALKDDEGRLGMASQEALTKAAKVDAGFAEAFVEIVE